MPTPYEDKKREDEARRREAERLQRERAAREAGQKSALRNSLFKALQPHARELEADGFRLLSGDYFVSLIGFEARRGGVDGGGEDTAGAGLLGYPWIVFLDKPEFAKIEVEMGYGKSEGIAEYRHSDFRSADTSAAVEHVLDVAVKKRDDARRVLMEYNVTKASVAASSIFVTMVWGAAALLLLTLWSGWGGA